MVTGLVYIPKAESEPGQPDAKGPEHQGPQRRTPLQIWKRAPGPSVECRVLPVRVCTALFPPWATCAASQSQPSCGHSSRTSFRMYSSFRTISTLVFLQTGRFKARLHQFHAYVPGHGGAHCATQLLCPEGETGNPLNVSPLSSVLYPICGSTRFLFGG